jgi:hypothetical protein
MGWGMGLPARRTVRAAAGIGDGCKPLHRRAHGGRGDRRVRATDKRIAIVVDPSLAIGLIANTVATIAGAAEPAFGNVTLTDAAGRLIKNSADRPVPILQAPAEAILATLLRALPTREGEIVVPFPQFAPQPA